MSVLKLMVALAAFTLATTGRAETVLLVQGFAAPASDWRSSGVARELALGGWSDAGELTLTDHAVAARAATGAPTYRRFYTLDLPTRQVLRKQLSVLERYVAFTERRHPNESLTLVGHSAGGVLARLFMVEHPEVRVAALITVASPHLGTELAEAGALISDNPIVGLAALLGADPLGRTGGLLKDLVPQRPGTFLYWLNHQEHPPSRYIGVIREQQGLAELAVPLRSQNLNSVYALRGRVTTLRSRGRHGLTRADGKLLLSILDRLGSA